MKQTRSQKAIVTPCLVIVTPCLVIVTPCQVSHCVAALPIITNQTNIQQTPNIEIRKIEDQNSPKMRHLIQQVCRDNKILTIRHCRSIRH